MRRDGKVAIVTGAATGIGQPTAKTHTSRRAGLALQISGAPFEAR